MRMVRFAPPNNVCAEIGKSSKKKKIMSGHPLATPRCSCTRVPWRGKKVGVRLEPRLSAIDLSFRGKDKAGGKQKVNEKHFIPGLLALFVMRGLFAADGEGVSGI